MGSTADQIETPTKFPRVAPSAGYKGGLSGKKWWTGGLTCDIVWIN